MFKCNAHGLIPLNGLSVNRFTRSESPRGYIPRVVIIDIEYILYIYGRYAACIRFGSALGAVYTITPAPRLTETLGAVYTITGASQNNWLSRLLSGGICGRPSSVVSYSYHRMHDEFKLHMEFRFIAGFAGLWLSNFRINASDPVLR